LTVHVERLRLDPHPLSQLPYGGLEVYVSPAHKERNRIAPVVPFRTAGETVPAPTPIPALIDVESRRIVCTWMQWADRGVIVAKYRSCLFGQRSEVNPFQDFLDIISPRHSHTSGRPSGHKSASSGGNRSTIVSITIW
jgi:hypothetical protein